MMKTPTHTLSNFLKLQQDRTDLSDLVFEVLIFEDDSNLRKPDTVQLFSFDRVKRYFLEDRKHFWSGCVVITLLNRPYSTFDEDYNWTTSGGNHNNGNVAFRVLKNGKTDFSNSRANEFAQWVYSVKSAYNSFPSKLVSAETVEKYGMSRD